MVATKYANNEGDDVESKTMMVTEVVIMIIEMMDMKAVTAIICMDNNISIRNCGNSNNVNNNNYCNDANKMEKQKSRSCKVKITSCNLVSLSMDS